MTTGGKIANRTSRCIFIVLFALLFSLRGANPAFSSPDGAIDVIGNDALCVVFGDFSKQYKSGDKIEVVKAGVGVTFAKGLVEEMKPSFMAVRVYEKLPDYFVEAGDFVRPPAPPKKIPLKSLRASIKPPEEEEGAVVGVEGATNGGEKTKINSESVSDSSIISETYDGADSDNSSSRLLLTRRQQQIAGVNDIKKFIADRRAEHNAQLSSESEEKPVDKPETKEKPKKKSDFVPSAEESHGRSMKINPQQEF